jgi:uncharacterized membrane protein
MAAVVSQGWSIRRPPAEPTPTGRIVGIGTPTARVVGVDTPTPTGRIVGIDVARCLALVGMICTHLVLATGPGGQVTVPQQIAGGRSAALFAVLSGVSLALLSGGTTPVTGVRLFRARCALVVRAVLIATLGLWLGQLQSGVAVILTYYGLLFLLALPFLTLRSRTLAALAAAVALVVPVLSHLLRPHLPRTTIGQPTPDDLDSVALMLSDLTLTGTYPALAWTAYLLLGLALGRLPLARPAVAARIAVVGAGLALAAWLTGHLVTGAAVVQAQLTQSFTRPPLPWAVLEQRLINGLHGTTPTDTWWWLLVAAPHSTTPVDLAQTGGSAMAVLGLCVLVTRWRPRMWSVVGGAGAMALSLYSVHVLLAATRLPRTEPYAAQWHLALVLGIGAAFAAARLKGPLEWLVACAGRAVADGCLRAAGVPARVTAGVSPGDGTDDLPR